MANLGYIQLTRCCNQRCVFCSNPPNGRVIDLEQAKRHVDEFVEQGYGGIILTGGEPTLFPALRELVAYAQQRGMPSRLISNGQKTCDIDYLRSLVEAGLTHLHLSIYSLRDAVQDRLARTPGSLANLKRSLDHAGALNITADVNTVICASNADHLHETVQWVMAGWPFVRHFVWNLMDPAMNPSPESDAEVAQFPTFELSLWKAMRALDAAERTFRVERVPLCFMTEFAHCSTETRKIVKDEERTIHFLDEKETVHQTDFRRDKPPCCRVCALDAICSGVYMMDRYYASGPIHPVFVEAKTIRDKVLRRG